MKFLLGWSPWRTPPLWTAPIPLTTWAPWCAGPPKATVRPRPSCAAASLRPLGPTPPGDLIGRDAVDEFVQDVLLLLVEALRAGAIEDPPRVGGFVLGICHNLARDRVRAQERRAGLWERFGSELAVAFEPTEPRACGYEVAQLEDCLSQLSARSRQIIKLTFIDDEPNERIAAALALAEGNVRVVRHRTLNALRNCMSQKLSWEVA